MRTTTNYKFVLSESGEKFLYQNLNQNFEQIDTVLFEELTKMGKAIKDTIDNLSSLKTPIEFKATNVASGESVFTFTLAEAEDGTLTQVLFNKIIDSAGAIGLQFTLPFLQLTGTLSTDGDIYEKGKKLSEKYAAVGHTHAYLPLSGGTLTGAVTATGFSTAGAYTSTGNHGWYNSTYDGGWYMQDATWIRAYGDKSIHTGGNIQAGGTIYEGGKALNTLYAPKSHTHDYAASNHTHSYLPLTGGTLTGNLTAPSVYTSNWFRSTGASGWINETYGGGWFMSDTTWIQAYGGKSIYTKGNMNVDGTITGGKVVNAVWNDYAEYFPKGEETEPGDIIALDIESDDEVYVKASISNSYCVVGVHSDTYGHIVGGDKVDGTGEEYFKHNDAKFIPVGLAGRVRVKFIGEAKKGVKVVPSDMAGVGRAYNAETDTNDMVIGFLVETDDIKANNIIRRLNMKILR